MDVPGLGEPVASKPWHFCRPTTP